MEEAEGTENFSEVVRIWNAGMGQCLDYLSTYFILILLSACLHFYDVSTLSSCTEHSASKNSEVVSWELKSLLSFKIVGRQQVNIMLYAL